MNYEQLEIPNGVPVKMWTNGVPVEEDAKNQLRNIARLPIVFKHVAVMPDVHLGSARPSARWCPPSRPSSPLRWGWTWGAE